MPDVLLPAAFSDLEPFASTWCLATESERFAKRMASTMEEMHAFYDAGFSSLRFSVGNLRVPYLLALALDDQFRLAAVK